MAALQRLPAETATGTGATAVTVPLKRPLPLRPVAVEAHLCSIYIARYWHKLRGSGIGLLSYGDAAITFIKYTVTLS